jgi:seryl-tRNA synthetase
MLDLKLIRSNPELIKSNLKNRNETINIDHILEFDEKRRTLESELGELNALKNRLSPEIGKMIKEGKDPAEIKEQVQNANKRIKEIEPEIKSVLTELEALLLLVPNICHTAAPIGGEESNKVVKEWGNKRVFDFQLKDHRELATALGIMDEERAVKVSGSGYIALFGKGAKLERALLNFFLDTHTNKNGFKEVIPPMLVHSQSMLGTGQLPKFQDQSYYIQEDDMFIIPTAEVPVTNLHREEVFQESELPISYVAYTPCFRREAGSYGTGVKGFLRTHQFNKVEMVKFSLPENSDQDLENLVRYATAILEDLNIPYRVLDLATGDMGFGASRCFDIEVWSPAENKFLEASSCSNFTDFQARRMNIKVKRGSSKPEFIHTLNGSGLATSRLLVSLLENNQNEDGSINIPEVLIPYTGFNKIEKQ